MGAIYITVWVGHFIAELPTPMHLEAISRTHLESWNTQSEKDPKSHPKITGSREKESGEGEKMGEKRLGLIIDLMYVDLVGGGGGGSKVHRNAMNTIISASPSLIFVLYLTYLQVLRLAALL